MDANKTRRKKLDGNYTGMLRTILNKFLKQQPTKQQLYGHLPHISKVIKVRRTKYVGEADEVLLRKSKHGRTSVGGPARTYLHQLCADTGCSLEDLLR